MDIPLCVCEARDSKGLYKLARAGKIKGKSEMCLIKTTFFLLCIGFVRLLI